MIANLWLVITSVVWLYIKSYILKSKRSQIYNSRKREVILWYCLHSDYMTILDNVLKGRGITLLAKLYNKSYGFSSNHVQIWELDHKEGWAPKKWCFQTVVLEKTLESPFYSKEIKPVNAKGNHPWTFTGRIDDGGPILWPPEAKSQLIRKDPDSGTDRKQEEKGMTEDDMVG